MDEKSAIDLGKIGYHSIQLPLIEDMLVGAQGMVLLVGPTNSGKSTSMQSFARHIREVRGRTIKVLTVEDPVEYIIRGATQMPVGANASFNDLLKSTLRHDPDVLVVGEVRDSESAEAVKNIVLAGRKVLATLHVYEAMAAFSRLEELGVPRDVLYMKGFIEGIIYQRLLPLLCDCAIPWEDAVRMQMLDEKIVDRVQRTMVVSEHSLRVHNPQGCEHCRGLLAGYRGRTVCAEIVQPDERMLDALRRGDQETARAQWMGRSDLNTGFGTSALGHALVLMSGGLVDPRDVETQVSIIKSPQILSANSAILRPHEIAGAGIDFSARADDGNLLSVLYER